MANIKYKKTDILEISFGLSIEGTAKAASEVRLVINYHGKNYGTPALLLDGQYSASFNLADIPNIQDNSLLEMVIEIVINGRLFRPLKRTIEIVEFDNVALPQELPVNRFEEILNEPVPPLAEEVKKAKESLFASIFESEKMTIDEAHSAFSQVKKKDIKFDKPVPPPSVIKKEHDLFPKITESSLMETVFKTKEKPKKVDIRFDKIKRTVVKEFKIEPIEIKTAEVKFSGTIKKKVIEKKTEITPFTITEGKITYL
jgi:hypothetical protein